MLRAKVHLDRIQLRRGLAGRYAGFHAAENAEFVHQTPLLEAEFVIRPWHEPVALEGKPEITVQDADHLVRDQVQHYRLPDDLPVAAEGTLPEAVRNDHERLAAAASVLRCEKAAKCSPHVQD